ncbi:pilus assembly protein PilP [Thermodesulfatator autotrophicus]|uniref:Pilus assembly protein PilP n=1 Tax=Thermodesulfatator autotrophicus TaxID=1795632 RepID=A0A177E9C1_9BACT|nr:pilus assembly protein PilP [Thermodesulfatator autotrophicus]OAG27599.1 hypothetical protein TH606_06060 [Thermodesulfatator autotrophicus]
MMVVSNLSLKRLNNFTKFLVFFLAFFTCFDIALAGTKQKEDIFLKWQKAMQMRKSYKYNPVNFDPFKPIVINLKPLPAPQNVTVFLKNYDLSDLKLVGIIDTGSQKIAVIEDPSGKGFFLKVGSYIGRQGGKIVKITKCAVYISQKFIDDEGNIIESSKPFIMKLSSEEGRCIE